MTLRQVDTRVSKGQTIFEAVTTFGPVAGNEPTPAAPVDDNLSLFALCPPSNYDSRSSEYSITDSQTQRWPGTQLTIKR